MKQFPTGVALAIEKKSRRIEISLYCLARAIESFCTCIADAGYLPHSKSFKRADVLVFSISTAIIMHCYAMERDVFRSKYLNVLDWVFGVPLPPYETTPRKRKWWVAANCKFLKHKHFLEICFVKILPPFFVGAAYNGCCRVHRILKITLYPAEQISEGW